MQNLVLRQCAAGELGFQCQAGDIFGDQVVDPIVVTKIKSHGHVGIGDLGEAQSFAAKLAARRITQERQLGKNFESDIAIELLIARAKYHSHTAGADLFDDAVAAKHLANRGGGSRHQRILGWRIAKVNNSRTIRLW